MKRLNCLIIDDEPASRDILERYIRDIPGLSLSGSCRDAFEASEFMAGNAVDLLFLDINMPRLSGVSFARSLSRAPLIIFTTAYPEYAVEGFELEAVDYLVKPFSFERFLKAVNRAYDRTEKTGTSKWTENGERAEMSGQLIPGGPPEPTLLIRSDKKIYSVRLSALLYIEACGDYIKVHLDDGKMHVVHDTIKRFLGHLPQGTFMRVHRSWVINVSKIGCIEGNRVHIGNTPIPVSPASRQVLLDLLENHR